MPPKQLQEPPRNYLKKICLKKGSTENIYTQSSTMSYKQQFEMRSYLPDCCLTKTAKCSSLFGIVPCAHLHANREALSLSPWIWVARSG